MGEPHHLGHPAALLGRGEVAAHAGADVAARADVEDAVAAVLEEVDAGGAGQGVGEEPLASLRRGDPGAVARELLEGVDAEVADALDQAVQHVDGGAGVVQRAVVGRGRRAEDLGERGEPVVRRLVAHDELARQLEGVEDREPGPRSADAGGGRLEEADVEAGVVGDEDAAGRELEEGGQRALDARRVAHHRVGDAGEHRDEGRDGLGRVDEGLELAEHLAAAHLDRADLGDAALRRACRRSSRGRRRRT